jgi:hypothetical protein
MMIKAPHPVLGRRLTMFLLSNVLGWKLFARFVDQVLDFELAYDDNDWSRMDRHFAPDAVYEVRNIAFACRLQGRDFIMNGFRRSLDGFDRRLAKRTIYLTSLPREKGDTLDVDWCFLYRKPGCPPLALRGHSTAKYRGDMIVHLVDAYPDGMDEEVARWNRESGASLDASYVEIP